MAYDGPILDNHLHLDRERGKGIAAVEEFVAAGGTHLVVINKPSWSYGVNVTDPADFEVGYGETMSIVDDATEVLPGMAWAALGVHPALISRLVDDRGFTPQEAASLMSGGIDRAAQHVVEGTALALKSGRPHYDVSEELWDASNDVLRHALERAAAIDCAVQLHTEQTTDLREITEWAAAVGLPAQRVVKHYAGDRLEGPVPSVIARPDPIEAMVNRGVPFLMETDYLDDPDRPGAVLGPKTVPRRVEWLLSEGHQTAVERAHVETPELVYDLRLE